MYVYGDLRKAESVVPIHALRLIRIPYHTIPCAGAKFEYPLHTPKDVKTHGPSALSSIQPYSHILEISISEHSITAVCQYREAVC